MIESDSKPGSSKETREHPRFDITAFVDYAGTEVLLYHRIENISLGGICIQTASIEEIGTLVDLVISFPDLDAVVSVQGEVVWANHERPQDMGIRFVDLDEAKKEILRRHINSVRGSKA